MYERHGKVMETKRAGISDIIARYGNVQNLISYVNAETLKAKHMEMPKKKATGIDKTTWEEYNENLDGNIETLLAKMKQFSYRPQPARRVYIPKANGGWRPLGIPCLEDKVLQRAVTMILEAVYEQDFLDCSYGFRPKRSCHQALKTLNDLITFRPVSHVVEADIKGFFDNMSHEELMEFLRIRIADTSLLTLINKFLKAGYIDERLLIRTEKGTPQGSILSPMLANVFLHYVLDTWFNSVVKNHVGGFCEIVRYADDFVSVVQNAGDAERIERALKSRFGRYGLEIHPTKSRNISFGRYERQNAERQNRRPNTFDYLGFTHFCDLSRRGKFKIGRRTSRKKFAAKCKAMNEWLGKIRNKVETKEWWKILKAKVRGHIQYYGVSENYASIAKFYKITVKLAHKWLNRRSQKKKDELGEVYPLSGMLSAPETENSAQLLRGVKCSVS